MDGRVDGWMKQWMEGRMDGWTDGWLAGKRMRQANWSTARLVDRLVVGGWMDGKTDRYKCCMTYRM